MAGVCCVGGRRIRGFALLAISFSTVGKLAPDGGRGSRSPRH